MTTSANGLIRATYTGGPVVFGLRVRNGTVVEAPPIAKWTQGLEARSAWRRLARRGAVLQWKAHGTEEWVR